MPDANDKTPAASAVATSKVHPLAWKRALALAGGNARRIRRDSETTVTVVNQPA